MAACLAALAAHAQSSARSATPVRLEPIRSVRAGVAAWPLLVQPQSAAERAIDADLMRRNGELRQSLSECDKEWMESAGAQGTGAGHGEWKRTVRVTMAGPRFLSLVANEEMYCGGAYPSAETLALVYDLRSGALVDWSQAVSAGKSDSEAADTGDAGSEMPEFVSEPLRKLYQARADKECREVFDGDVAFLVWPDAKKQRLTVLADGLPHVVAACAQEVDLTLDEARKLGFRGEILGAIQSGFQPVATPGR